MLIEVYNFENKNPVEKIDVDLEHFLSSRISWSFLNMHFTRMKKYHHIPTNHTKAVPEISGTTAKPHRQKGLGRSRQGTRRGPQHRGGVKIFGPQAIKRKIGLPKAEVRLAKKMLLKIAYEKQRLFIIGNCDLPDHKTRTTLKYFRNFLPTPQDYPNVLVIHNNEAKKENFLSIRNLARAKYASSQDFTVQDILKSNTILITKSGLTNLLTSLA